MPWTNSAIRDQEPGYDDHADQAGRRLSFVDALREAHDLALANDPRVFVMGVGADDPGGVFGTTLGLHNKYGPERVFDVPLSEAALTGIAAGAAIAGARPVFVHIRADFLLLTMDQFANHAAKWSYMFGGRVHVPMVVRAVIGRGWGSAAQHSQTPHGLFMHMPGIKVVLPATAHDAKGLLTACIADENPCLLIEHRWLFKHTGIVPDGLYAVPLGKGIVRKTGQDVTIAAVSYMVVEALRAAEELAADGIDAEVLDLRTLVPLDEDLLYASVRKTGRLIVADTDWLTAGASAEIAARVAENAFDSLKSPVRRVALPDLPTPASHVLEEVFYRGHHEIRQAARELCAGK